MSGRGLGCRGRGSAALGVFLADVAQPPEAVQVVETPVLVKVGAVLIPGAEPVAGPPVRLIGAPMPGTSTNRSSSVSGGGREARWQEAERRAHLRSIVYGVSLTHSHLPRWSVRPTQ